MVRSGSLDFLNLLPNGTSQSASDHSLPSLSTWVEAPAP